MRYLVATLCLGAFLQYRAVALDNGLALKPPLAYSNWNIVGGAVNESFIRGQAETLISTGLRDAGYNYVIVDDCWSEVNRDPQGRLQANLTTFPSGMKALGDYLHSQGLKFGMYADAGEKTCQGHPGSRGYEELDAQSFADWGVDYLKYDNCHASAEDWVVDRYSAMSRALNKTGRPILFAIVGWGVGDPWKGWGQQYGNVWRTDGDITASWPEISRVLDNSIGLMRYSKPGGWADLDMLEVNVGLLTRQEQRAHFGLWALMKSPLMLGTDLTQMDDYQLDLVSSPEVLAANQDALGVPGDLVWKEGPAEVYAGPLSDGSRVVGLLNRHTLATQYPKSDITVRWEWIGFPSKAQVTVRDMFAKQDIGVFNGSYTGNVDIHDIAMLKLTMHGDSSRYADWRPWNAKDYIPVPTRWPLGTVITLGVCLGVVSIAALILAGCLIRPCCGGHRRFARLAEGDKRRRTASGRLGSGDKAIETIA